MGNSEAVPAPQVEFVPGVSTESFTHRRGKDIIAQYFVVKRLGSGAFGQVFEVVDKTKTKFALKVIPIKNVKEFELVENEIKSLQKVSHPNIVKYHSSFSVSSPAMAACIVMECANGQSLRSFLSNQSKPLPVCAVMKWFLQLLEAVGYLHSLNCVHRDLKPDNIVIESSNTLKIVDFGISYWLQTEKKPDLAKLAKTVTLNKTTIAGTPAYLDPEVLFKMDTGGRGIVDASNDIWSLGCILYEALSLRMIVEAIDPSNPNVPGFFKNISKKLAKFGEQGDLAKSLVPLLQMMLSEQSSRASAKTLLASDAILGWRAAFDPNSPSRPNAPTTKPFLAAFIATLFDRTSSAVPIRLMNWDYVCRHMSAEPAVAMAAIEHGIVDAAFGELQGESIDEVMEEISAAALDVLFRAMQQLLAGPRVTAAAHKCLRIIFNNVKLAPIGAMQVTCQNYDMLKKRTLSGDEEAASLLGLLYFQKPGLHVRTLPHFLHCLVKENRKCFLRVFAMCAVVNEPLFLEFLQLLPAQDPPEVMNLVDQVFRVRGCSANLSSPAWKKVLSRIYSWKDFASSVSIQRRLFQNLVSGCFAKSPEYLIQKCNSENVCTYTATGPFFSFPQPLIVCMMCTSLVCARCASVCHKDHPLLAHGSTLSGSCECTRRCIDAEPLKFLPYQAPEVLLEPHKICETDKKSWCPEMLYSETTYELMIRPEPSNRMQFMFQSCGYCVERVDSSKIQFYFELGIEGQPIHRHNVLAFGLSEYAPGIEALFVGTNKNQWGWHCDDGAVYVDNSRKNTIARYESGDVVGCGVTGSGDVFWTKNGLFMGFCQKARQIPAGMSVFATISSRSWEVKISINFDGPFRWLPVLEGKDVSVWKNGLKDQISREALTNLFGNLTEQTNFTWTHLYDSISQFPGEVSLPLMYLMAIYDPSVVGNLFNRLIGKADGFQTLAKELSKVTSIPLGMQMFKLLEAHVPADLVSSVQQQQADPQNRRTLTGDELLVKLMEAFMNPTPRAVTRVRPETPARPPESNNSGKSSSTGNSSTDTAVSSSTTVSSPSTTMTTTTTTTTSTTSSTVPETPKSSTNEKNEAAEVSIASTNSGFPSTATITSFVSDNGSQSGQTGRNSQKRLVFRRSGNDEEMELFYGGEQPQEFLAEFLGGRVTKLSRVSGDKGEKKTKFHPKTWQESLARLPEGAVIEYEIEE